MDVHKSKTPAIIAGIAAAALVVPTGAVAAGLVTSADIENDSVRSVDIKDGTIRGKDIKPNFATKSWSSKNDSLGVTRLKYDPESGALSWEDEYNQPGSVNLATEMVTVEESADWVAGSNTTVATCAPGSVLTGGGYDMQQDNDGNAHTVLGSKPKGNAWVVFGKGAATHAEPGVNVYALCEVPQAPAS